MRKTVRRPDSEWYELIEAFQNSGMTVYKWCAKEGISVTTFRRKIKLVSPEMMVDDKAASETLSESVVPMDRSSMYEEQNSTGIIDAGDICCKEATDDALPKESVNMDFIEFNLLPELGRISKYCKTVYLVDTENVSGEPIGSLLKSIDEFSRVLMFYTKKSNYIPYDALGAFFEKSDQISLISCDCGTENALDFQLVSVLGCLISDCRHSGVFGSEIPEFIIFSKDHGFDAAIKFWKMRGVSIRRAAPDEILKPEKKEAVAKITESSTIPLRDEKIQQCKTVESKSQDKGDAISRYYLAHPEYQQSMAANLCCRVGSEFKRRGIKLSKKPPVMDMLLKNPVLKENDLNEVCTADAAKLLLKIPADFIKMQREAAYNRELKLHSGK